MFPKLQAFLDPKVKRFLLSWYMEADCFYCKFQKMYLPELVSLAASDISDSDMKFLNF